jgi:hypothetical protein
MRRSTDYPFTHLSQTEISQSLSKPFYLFKQNHTNTQDITKLCKNITDYKVKCLPEIWRQDAVENGSLEPATPVRKRREPEKNKKEKKKHGF